MPTKKFLHLDTSSGISKAAEFFWTLDCVLFVFGAFSG